MNFTINQNLSAIFADAEMHKAVWKIIEHHSTNKLDVRTFALDGLNLQSKKTILDLGCGFGFFTRSLIGKIPLRATILGIDRFPENSSFFLESCNYIGIEGRFNSSGINSLKRLKDNSYDLILCSYAIYFFPEIIPDVARILKPEGIFIIITHSNNHAVECIDYVKETFLKLGIQPPPSFPHELLMARFNHSNGHKLLSPFFEKVKEKDYVNSLIFNIGDFDKLKLYFEFKKPYYLPNVNDGNKIYIKTIHNLKADLQSGIPFKITKNDTIFVCRKTLLNEK